MYRLNMIPKKKALEIFCSQCDTSLRRFRSRLKITNQNGETNNSANIEEVEENG